MGSHLNRVFVTSDTHFGHSKIIEFELSRSMFANIKEHDEALVTYWNETVRPTDTVWHLGDVVFGVHNIGILSQLHGIKHLVMGNHDQYPITSYAEHFHKIRGAVQMHGFIFTHIPVHPNQLNRFEGNVHGHSHSKSVGDPRYLCACLEHHKLRPVLLDKLLADGRAAINAAAEPKCRVCGTTEGLRYYPQGPCCDGPDCVAF